MLAIARGIAGPYWFLRGSATEILRAGLGLKRGTCATSWERLLLHICDKLHNVRGFSLRLISEVFMHLKSMVWGLCLLLCSAWAQAQTAAYIRGASQPWGESTNEAAMDLAFGAGNWSNLTMAGGVAPFLSGSGYQFIFLEGGDETAVELNNYLTANRTQIEAFVSAGGVCCSTVRRMKAAISISGLVG
jgi:hypothetical protein